MLNLETRTAGLLIILSECARVGYIVGRWLIVFSRPPECW